MKQLTIKLGICPLRVLSALHKVNNWFTVLSKSFVKLALKAMKKKEEKAYLGEVWKARPSLNQSSVIQ